MRYGVLSTGGCVVDTQTIEDQVGQSLSESIDDYRLSLHAAGKSKNTQSVYTLALTYLDRFLAAQGMPRQLSGIRREHIEAWLGALRDEGRAPATVSVYYRVVAAVLAMGHRGGLRPRVPDGQHASAHSPGTAGPGPQHGMTCGRSSGLATAPASATAGTQPSSDSCAYTGIRRGELAGLTTTDVTIDPKAGRGSRRRPRQRPTPTDGSLRGQDGHRNPTLPPGP